MKPFQLVGRGGVAAGVVRRADGAGIPLDPANADYQQFLAWQAAGGVPDPVDADPPAAADPNEVTVRRLARALIRSKTITLEQLLAEQKD